jgi:hypothetical protein
MSETYVYITLGGIGIVVLSILLKYCYKSKCVSIDLCYGAVHVERDIGVERTQSVPDNNSADLSPNAFPIRFSRIV